MRRRIDHWLGIGATALVLAVGLARAHTHGTLPPMLRLNPAIEKSLAGVSAAPDEILACTFSHEGRPLARSTVIEVPAPENWTTGERAEFHETDEDGCVRLSGRHPRWLWTTDGRESLDDTSLLDDLGFTVWSPPSAVLVGPDTPRAVWNLGSTCPQSFTVVDAAGAPIAGVQLNARSPSSSWSRVLGKTDALGRIEQAAVPCDLERISAVPPAPFHGRSFLPAQAQQPLRLGRDRPILLEVSRSDGVPVSCEDLPGEHTNSRRTDCLGPGRYRVWVDELSGDVAWLSMPRFEGPPISVPPWPDGPVPYLLEEQRSDLGFELVHWDDDLAVRRVVSSTPAAELDLEKGDRIVGVSVAGVRVRDRFRASFIRRANRSSRLLPLTLEVERNGKTHEVRL